MRIFLKNLRGVCVPLEVESDEPVVSLKRKIYEQENVPAWLQYLIIDGQENPQHPQLLTSFDRFGNILTLLAFNIGEDATVTMVPHPSNDEGRYIGLYYTAETPMSRVERPRTPEPRGVVGAAEGIRGIVGASECV